MDGRARDARTGKKATNHGQTQATTVLQKPFLSEMKSVFVRGDALEEGVCVLG